MSEATRAYQQESDPLAEFLEGYECCPDGVVESAQLRRDYQQWASENGDKPLDSRALAARLRARGFVDVRIGNRRARAWRGLKPKDDASVAQFSESADMRTDADAEIQ